MIQKGRNVHVYKSIIGEKTTILNLSDLHWDNPKCDRKLLKRHLDQAKEKGAVLLLNGDIFCAMQGKYDPRRSKKDIRAEHNVANYLDALVSDAIKWFEPYKEMTCLAGYGNHETAILKNLETDILSRFVDGMGENWHLGGYGGWLVILGEPHTKRSISCSYKIKYYHGFGGGGAVTKGTIQHNRFATMVEGADMVAMGHVHEDNEMTYVKEQLDNLFNVIMKQVKMIRTSTYKEEYEDGFGGYHIEKGRPPKPLGGKWIEIDFVRLRIDGSDRIVPSVKTYTTDNGY